MTRLPNMLWKSFPPQGHLLFSEGDRYYLKWPHPHAWYGAPSAMLVNNNNITVNNYIIAFSTNLDTPTDVKMPSLLGSYAAKNPLLCRENEISGKD